MKTPMRVLRPISISALAGVILSGVMALAQGTAPAVRIVNPVNDKELVTLKGTVHPLANARNDRGAVADDTKLERIHLVLKRSTSQESSLRQLITSMHTPGSASYHKWLTPDQFGKQFGPSDQDVATVENWLSSHGFNGIKVNPGRQSIEFSGNAAQFKAAFHTQIHQYAVNGQVHTANASDPQIPAALAPVVSGFFSLNNFPMKSNAHYLGKAQYNPKTDQAKPEWTIGSTSSGISLPLAPGDLAVQYDLNPLYAAGVTGNQQTIAIINEANVNIGLVNSFRSLFGLPYNPPQVIIDGNDPGIDGVNNPDGPNYASGEAYLDVEWSGAIAPNANIELVIAADGALESGLVLAAERAVYSDVAPVLSMSFGGCEVSNGNFTYYIGGLWEQAAAQGQTVMVSSGDEGSAECDSDQNPYATRGLAVNALSSSPWNVSVGGTDFYYSQYSASWDVLNAQLGTYWNLTPSNNTPAVSLKSVIPEMPFNDSQYNPNVYDYYSSTGTTSMFASGGGASMDWAKPAWQSGAGVPDDGARDQPDVSLFGANGINLSYYPACTSDGDCQPVASGGMVQISGYGGTSLASPAFAGMMALVNQKYGPQGQANFVLYPMAAQFPAAFHDVTVGTNSVPCDLTDATPDCIVVSNPITLDVTEGQIGTGTTPDYNAGPGYDMASGLGTIDANQMVTNWNKVTFAGTTTTLTASSTTFAHGTPVTFSGMVTSASGPVETVKSEGKPPSSTPTGDVALLTDSTEPNNQGETFFSLNGGAYSGSVSFLPGGTYNVWAQYSGDTANGISDSAKTQITVTPEASTTLTSITDISGQTMPSGTTGIPYGTQLIAVSNTDPTAYYNQCIVGPGTAEICMNGVQYPTGSATFSDSGKALTTAQLNADGNAQYNGVYAVGSHSVTAAYLGDNSYAASTGSPVTFAVVKDVPAMGVGTSAALGQGQVQGGQAIILQFQVANSANLSTISALNSYVITPAASPTGTITVTGLPEGTPNTSTLSPNTDPNYLIPEGVGNLVLPANLAAGNYTVTVNYSGDANYTAASTGSTVTILPAAGLASTTTATMTGTLSPVSSGITISGTVTGQTGQAAPTGQIMIVSNGVVVAYSNLTSGTGDSSTYSSSFNSSMLPPGTNLLVVQYLGDGVYNQSAATLNALSNSQANFTLQAATPILPVTAGSTGTETINLSSNLGFAGMVNLTCSSGAGVSCTISPSATLTAGGTASATLTIQAQAQTANMSYPINVVGTDSTGAYVNTAEVTVQVSGSPAGSKSFAFVYTGTPMAVTPGLYTGNTTTVNLWPLGGFSGTVNLSCSVSGQTTTFAPTCFVSTPTIALSGFNPVSTVVTVNTVLPGQAANHKPELFWPVSGGTALALVLFLAVPKRRRNWLAMMVLAAIVASFASMGCSSYQTTKSNLTGTPTGAYTITVTGVSGNVTQSTTVSLTVN